MDSKLILLCLGLCLIALVVKETEAKEVEELNSSEEKDDKDEDSQKNKGFLSSITTCGGKKWERPHTITKAQKKCDGIRKKAKEDKDESKIGAVCDAACVFKQADLFKDDNYKIDQSAIDDLVEEILAGELSSGRPALKKAWKGCKAEFDGDAKDNEKCKKIKPYFKCVLSELKKHCSGANAKPAAGLLGNLLG